MLRPQPSPAQAVPTTPEHRRTLASQRGPGKYAEDGDKVNPTQTQLGSEMLGQCQGDMYPMADRAGLHQEAAGTKTPLTPAGGVTYAH